MLSAGVVFEFLHEIPAYAVATSIDRSSATGFDLANIVKVSPPSEFAMESTGTLRLGFADHLRNVEVAFARASLFFLRTSDDRRLHICHDLGCDQNSVIATGGYVQWRIMFHISPCPFPLEINVDLDLPDVAVDDSPSGPNASTNVANSSEFRGT